MELNSFAKLEEQIARAITHIEKLAGQIVQLDAENGELKDKVAKLERELQLKHEMLIELERSSSSVAEQAREKIEAILNRIEGYEKGKA